MDAYYAYSQYVGSIVDDNKTELNFKSNSDYRQILEHLTKVQGREYLECIFSLTSITKDEIIQFCALNDAIGTPIKEEYNDYLLDVLVSPSSLRYILHAHLILTHMNAIGNMNADVIEVGGGYGGLCLSMYFFAPKYGICINSYKICDLPNIIRLQKIYLNRVNPKLNIDFVDATSFGANINCKNMFLISNYCFSEISKENQDSYRQFLFPKISHGFMAWNYIPVYNFGFTHMIEPEKPNTGGPMNKYVYF
jgi:hypothetical protein